VNTKQKHPVRLLQPFPIPEWKWEEVMIGFITKFPIKSKQHDSITLVLYNITKVAHFIPVKTTFKETIIAEICMKEIARLHGVPKEIVSDRYLKFTSNLWKGFFKGFGTNLNSSTTYHPELDG
jgi:hypothetical protein